MSLKDSLDTAKKGLTDAVDNVRDVANELLHRDAAQAEQAKRDIAGDQMSPGEYAGSVIKQGTNELQAGISAAKRETR